MNNELMKGFLLSLAISIGILALGFGGVFLFFNPESGPGSFAFIGALASVSLGAPLIILGILFCLYLKYRNQRPDFAKGFLFFLSILILLTLIIWYLIKLS